MKKASSTILSSVLTFTLLCSSLIISSCSPNESNTPVTSEFPGVETALTPQSELSASESGNELVLNISLTSASKQSLKEDIIYVLAMKYMEQHPGVTINIDFETERIARDENNPEYPLYVKYILNLKKLHSGKGPDIIRFEHESEFNLALLHEEFDFTDLNVFIQNDDKYDQDLYFANVLDSMQLYGKLLFMPLGFSFTYVSLNKGYASLFDTAFDSQKTINLYQMVQMYSKVESIINNTDIYMLDSALSFADKFRIGLDLDASDLDTKKFNCTSRIKPDLYQSLSKIPNIPKNQLLNLNDSSFFSLSPEIVFASSNNIASNLSYSFFRYGNTAYARPILFSGLDGKASCSYTDALAINDKSENKTLAWDFIKFCMSTIPTIDSGIINESDADKEIANFSRPAFHINRNLFTETLTTNLGRAYDKNSEAGLISNLDKESSIDETVARLDEMADSVSRVSIEQRYPMFFTIALDSMFENRALPLTERLLIAEQSLIENIPTY